MSASTVRITNGSVAQDTHGHKLQRGFVRRKPVNREENVLRRPAVLAMHESRRLIFLQWKSGRPIAEIADSWKVPRPAVEELLRAVVA